MFSTRGLYATTLALAGAAGFSSGWAVKPAEKVVLTEEESLLLDYERVYDLSEADRAALKEAIRAYRTDLGRLRDEVSRHYGAQIQAIENRHDAVIAAICTEEKRKGPDRK